MLSSCGNKEDKDSLFIETEYGNMIIKLYDKTPKHKENFLKLVNEGFYDNQIFHKVIRGYIIMGGNPDSKYAEENKNKYIEKIEYTLTAEIIDTVCSKKGVLIAVREPDEINPNKESSYSQFFIVIGRKFTEKELKNYEEQMNITIKKQAISNYIKEKEVFRNKIEQLQYEENFNEMDSLIADIEKKIDIKEFKILDKHKKIYTKMGGIPNFTGEYTIFGEITEGLDIIDKISDVETGEENRPVKDIKIKIINKNK